MTLTVTVDTEHRASDGLADIHVLNDTGQSHQLDLPFRDLYRRCGVPSATALDLLLTASLCYVIDKTVPRSRAFDGWTRDLTVSLPVSDPQAWSGVATDLSETLAFLTGDSWHLSFFQAPAPLFRAPERVAMSLFDHVDAVSMFSGGLDSLAGGVDLLAEPGDRRVLFVGHYDGPGPKSVQAELAGRLAEQYPGRSQAIHVRVAHRPELAAEETLRSRSLVFLALGLYAAQACGAQVPLYMFENGLIALNIPLTPSRRGSCSTRTMHPYYLNRIRRVVQSLGAANSFSNPYELKTKGECIVQCQDSPFLAEIADTSVSCSHSSRRQDWARKQAENCGYCVPCMFRRAAMGKAGLDAGSQYGIDVLAAELRPEDKLESANDLRALVDFLRTPLTLDRMRGQIVATALVPDLDAHAALALRGFEEVKEWLYSSRSVTGSRAASTTNA
jgi:7-cyano-7-deazaguanine synthase in queuosine biosynthesis